MFLSLRCNYTLNRKMKTKLSLLSFCFISVSAMAQMRVGTNAAATEMLHVDGAILIGGTLVGAADAGTIRWNTTVTPNRFEGYNGTAWIPLQGDNLGDHIATENLQLDGNWLSNDGGNEGIRIDDAGNVGVGTDVPSSLLHVKGIGSNEQIVGLFEYFIPNSSSGSTAGLKVTGRRGQPTNDVAFLEFENDDSGNVLSRLHIKADDKLRLSLNDGGALNEAMVIDHGAAGGRILLNGKSTSEGGELQLNGGSSYTSSAYAFDNYEGRLRILRTTNANGSGGGGTSEVLSVKGTNQVGIGNIGGNTWPSESNLIIGSNGGSEGGQIQFYNSSGAGTAWFLDVFGNDFRFLTGNNITGSTLGGAAATMSNSGDLTMSGSVRALSGTYLFESGCSNELRLQADGNAVIYYGNGGFGGWASGTNCSDMRLKENIKDLESVLSVIQELDVIRYNYKEETGLPSGPQIGVNAQQLAKYFPELVYYNEEKDQYIVYYDKITTLLLKGMKEMIENLKISNASLSASYMSLKTELSEMKDWIQYKSQTSNE